MQTPKWFKDVEKRCPERLRDVNDSLETYAKSLASFIKGKGEYIEVAVPGLYEYNALKNISEYYSKKSAIAIGALSTGIRTAGIVGSLATGDARLVNFYVFPTAFFEVVKVTNNIFPNVQKKLDSYL